MEDEDVDNINVLEDCKGVAGKCENDDSGSVIFRFTFLISNQTILYNRILHSLQIYGKCVVKSTNLEVENFRV
jgi:hypothetical protein